MLKYEFLYMCLSDQTLPGKLDIKRNTPSNLYLFQVLSNRRMESDSPTSDPIVWTNSRVIEWVQTIDLEVILV